MPWLLEEKDEDIFELNQWSSWDVTESDFVIFCPTNLTNNDIANKQCNTMALNTIYNAIDAKILRELVKCGRD
jgi:hypothetical protein